MAQGQRVACRVGRFQGAQLEEGPALEGKCVAGLRPGEQRCLLEVFNLSLKKVENRIRKGGWAWILKALTGRPGTQCRSVHTGVHGWAGGAEVGRETGCSLEVTVGSGAEGLTSLGGETIQDSSGIKTDDLHPTTSHSVP